MKHFKLFSRGIIGALLLFGTAAPFALTSCNNERPELNITLTSDYSSLLAAMNDNNKSLVEKLGMIEQAIKQGFADNKSKQKLIETALKNLNGTLGDKLDAIETAITTQTTSFETKLGVIEAAVTGGFANDKDALGLIETAINTLKGTNEQKLAAIEEAINGQNTGIETKLGLIQTALETGLADQKTAIGELKTAIESLKGSVEGLNLNDRIDNIVASLDGIKGAIDTDIAALLKDIKDSIDGIQDYSEILAAIKTAIENIEINAGGEEAKNIFTKPEDEVSPGLYKCIYVTPEYWTLAESDPAIMATLADMLDLSNAPYDTPNTIQGQDTRTSMPKFPSMDHRVFNSVIMEKQNVSSESRVFAHPTETEDFDGVTARMLIKLPKSITFSVKVDTNVGGVGDYYFIYRIDYYNCDGYGEFKDMTSPYSNNTVVFTIRNYDEGKDPIWDFRNFAIYTSKE